MATNEYQGWKPKLYPRCFRESLYKLLRKHPKVCLIELDLHGFNCLLEEVAEIQKLIGLKETEVVDAGDVQKILYHNVQVISSGYLEHRPHWARLTVSGKKDKEEIYVQRVSE